MLRAEIEQAFAHRQRPSKVIESRSPVTPEQQDALWFLGRDWREIEWQDWEKHTDAFYAFVPEAFIYYLPSILISTMAAPGNQLLAADALLGVLTRSPEIYHWDAFITKRLLCLQPDEYKVLKAWVLSLSGIPHMQDEDGLTQAYETVDLLERETAKLRATLKDPG